jgi:elongation factor 1-beta
MPFKTIADLESHMATRSYVEGYALSKADTDALSALAGIPGRDTPNAFRWAVHIIALTGLENVTFSGATSSAKPAAAAKPAAKKAAADDDFDDMFGDDDEDEEPNEYGETAAEAAATKARQERMAQALKLKQEKDEKDGKTKKAKAKAVEKSLVVLEVKPWEADCDLHMVFNEIIKFELEGLVWGQAHELVPVAYGIKKLVMQCVIVDSLVLMDDVTDNIEAMEEWVQSVQVTAMTKV